MTTISWTHNPATGGRGATWNPVTGCTKVSSGCHNCYAIPLSHRLAGMATTRDKYRGLTKAGGSNWTGVVRCHEDVLEVPLKRKKPTTFFVNSMSDTFHEDVPDSFIMKMFLVMDMCQQHTFQILTKRSERMAEVTVAAPWFAKAGMTSYGKLHTCSRQVLSNVWLGVSVEDQAACVRIEDLIRCPAAVRFLSVEPMLERIDLTRILVGYMETELGRGPDKPYFLNAIDSSFPNRIKWVLIGGESAPKARPFNLEWAYDLIDQCQAANVPIFVKQIGSNARLQGEPYPRQHPDDRGKRTDPRFWPKPLQIQEYPQR